MIKEYYTTKYKETALNIVQSQIDSFRDKDITRTGLRVYDNGLIGVAGKLGRFDEKELEAEAIEALKLNIPYPYELSSDRHEEVVFDPAIPQGKDFINEIEHILSHLREKHGNLIFSGKAAIAEPSVLLKNEKDLDLYYKDKYLTLDFTYKEKSSANIIDGAVSYFGRKYERNMILNLWDNILNAYQNIVSLPSDGIYPVIFLESDKTPVTKLMMDLYGIAFGSGTSLLSDKKGKKAFNEEFTFYQYSDPVENIGSPFFDAEGVVNKDYRYALIEKGIVITPFTDKKTSKMFNLPLTGSSGCPYDGVPSLGLGGLKIKESDKTVKEILKGQHGIYVMMTAGGDFTPNGDFGAPLQLAFLFDGEKFIGRLPELNISSNIFDMFGKNYRGLSCDTILPGLSTDRFLVMDMNVSKI